MGWRAWWYEDALPLTAMIAVECGQVGLSTIYKAASLIGLSYYVFVFYSYAIGTLILLIPVLFILRSNMAPVLPSSKFPLFSRICLLALIGAAADMIGFKGLQYCSPTLASAMGNLVPAFTFILALIFRMEKLVLRSFSTQAKIMGTVVSISGALVVTLYKGPILLPTPSPTQSISLHQSLGSSHSSWVIGGLLLATDYLLWSLWFIVQKQIMKIYPAELIVVFLFYAIATILSAPVCFIAENNLSSWSLGSGIKLAAVIYSGLIGYTFANVVHTRAIHLKGPVYAASFKPLQIAIAAIINFIFLGDALYLGSVIGAVIITIGFYSVLWGMAKEESSLECEFDGLGASPDGKMPLLPSNY